MQPFLSITNYSSYFEVKVKVQLLCLNSNCYVVITFGISMSKVTAPQDAHKRLVLQVYLGSNTLELRAIQR